MNTQDFENAIVKMDSRIVLDEVKLNKGNVRRFYGHIGNKLIMWDEKGRGYSFAIHTSSDQEIDHNTHDGLPDILYVRNNEYDIHFDNI